jgi:hypothetical protein
VPEIVRQLSACGAREGGVGRVNDIPTFSNTVEALGTLRAAMSFLAAADATMMPATVQAQCLPGLEEIDSIEAVVRASVLRPFSAGH